MGLWRMIDGMNYFLRIGMWERIERREVDDEQEREGRLLVLEILEAGRGQDLLSWEGIRLRVQRR
jgi:hypothetical protein